jgi:starch phosphorylase
MSVPGGSDDLRRAAEDLAQRIPDELAPLARIAFNYRWSWTPGGADLFKAVDEQRFELCGENPVRLLQEASGTALRRAAHDQELLRRAAEVEQAIRADLERPPAAGVDPARPVAFFCAEYGVHRSLPVYSGGLGALAGDLLKEASDMALPLVAVGLMYGEGYFRQRVDASGWQQEYYVRTDPQRLPAALVTGSDGRPVTVCVAYFDSELSARIWRVEVGRVPLFLLDADIPENRQLDRWITARLYDGDSATRLAQYMLLGLGGIRALRALGIEPGVLHLNEGHAALAAVELARPQIEPRGSLEAALEAARELTVFTTHTPVPAGNDTYPADHFVQAVAPLIRRLGAPAGSLLRLGRTNPDNEGEAFGVTQAALRLSRHANAVSRRHGEVAREMWHPLWPDAAGPEGVPIGHVTNGVHVPTWVGGRMRELLDRHLGAGWIEAADDPDTWAAVDDIPDDELWEVRRRQRAELIAFVRERSVADRLARGDLREYVGAAAAAFDPDVLTIGFARRVATYKRLHLLVQDPLRTLGLLSGERPVQVILAGKAHPRDTDAKRVLQGLYGMKAERAVAERVIFLDDYDLGSAAKLVQGCDVWLNVPRPPLEASGTSGMKSVMNGGLQLSVLDGWWAEGYDGHNGWALPGEVDPDHAAQDARDADRLYTLLSGEVVPAFYDRDADGIPQAWLQRIRASLRTLGPRFSAGRMLSEYVEQVYRSGQAAATR